MGAGGRGEARDKGTAIADSIYEAAKILHRWHHVDVLTGTNFFCA
jgi:hypothetical protein